HLGSTEDGSEKESRVGYERDWRRFLEEASGMGLDLLITEFDVHDRDLPAAFAVRDAAVADIARRYLDLTLSFPKLRKLMTWGLADPMSWWQDRDPRADGLPKRCCPYDADLKAKPLREAIAASLRGMPQRASA